MQKEWTLSFFKDKMKLSLCYSVFLVIQPKQPLGHQLMKVNVYKIILQVIMLLSRFPQEQQTLIFFSTAILENQKMTITLVNISSKRPTCDSCNFMEVCGWCKFLEGKKSPLNKHAVQFILSLSPLTSCTCFLLSYMLDLLLKLLNKILKIWFFPIRVF